MRNSIISTPSSPKFVPGRILERHAGRARSVSLAAGKTVIREAGLVKEEPKAVPQIDPGIKGVYRKAVKLIHPDLALSEHERQRRTKLMTLVNLAYECG